MLYISATTIPLSGQSDNRMVLDRSYPGTMYNNLLISRQLEQESLSIIGLDSESEMSNNGSCDSRSRWVVTK